MLLTTRTCRLVAALSPNPTRASRSSTWFSNSRPSGAGVLKRSHYRSVFKPWKRNDMARCNLRLAVYVVPVTPCPGKFHENAAFEHRYTREIERGKDRQGAAGQLSNKRSTLLFAWFDGRSGRAKDQTPYFRASFSQGCREKSEIRSGLQTGRVLILNCSGPAASSVSDVGLPHGTLTAIPGSTGRGACKYRSQ